MHEFLSKEQNIVLSLTANSMGYSYLLSSDYVSSANFKRVVVESAYQSVMLPCFSACSLYKDYILDDVYDTWREVSVSSTASNLKVLGGQKELTTLLDENGYEYVILKGTSASVNYPNPSVRMLGDVDFLIAPTKKEELKQFMLNNGYVLYDQAHISHYTFTKNGVTFEMHFEVAGIPYGEKGEKVRKFLEKTLKNREKAVVDGVEFYKPSNKDNALILLLHSQHHLLGEGLGLRHLCDWAGLVTATKNQPFFEETLIPFLKDIGLYKFACALTVLCEKFLNMPSAPLTIDDDKLLRDLIVDVFSSGNFGGKDKNRASSSMLISERGKGGVKHGAVYNLAHSLHKAVMLQYPVIKKVPILYPFIYLYKAVRFLFLSIIGKRPSISKMLPEAEKRKKIYEKLNVFE